MNSNFKKGGLTMLNLSELKQLTVFADCGTLSKASEALHISQPTLTRSMKHVEETFGVPLFNRGKNKLTLNETGLLAVEYARKLLSEEHHALEQVQAFDQKLHTIAVESCAPAPLWTLLPLLSAHFPQKTISSSLVEIPVIIDHVLSGKCEIGILPFSINNPPPFADQKPFPAGIQSLSCIPFLREELSVCIPKDQAMAQCESLTFAQLNGFNCLLRSQIGFWNELCSKKMPASKFLVQEDDFAFRELVRASSLPCFTTNLASDSGILHGRNIIPITDPEANVTYHLLFPARKKEYQRLFLL